MGTTLDLPDPLYRALKARSALRGMRLKDYVAEILQTGLAHTAAAQAQARLRSPLPVIRKATGVPHPALSNREIDALLAAETQKLGALKTHKRALMQQLFPSPESTTNS
jgi:hypothetical protein